MSWLMSKKSFLTLALSFCNEMDRNEKKTAIKCFLLAWLVFSIPSLVVVSVGSIFLDLFLDKPPLLSLIDVMRTLLVTYIIMTVNVVVDFVRHGTMEDE